MGHRAPTHHGHHTSPEGRGGPEGDPHWPGLCSRYQKGSLRHRQRPLALALAGQGLAGSLAMTQRISCRASQGFEKQLPGSTASRRPVQLRLPAHAGAGGSPGRFMGLSMAPTARAQRHGAGRAGASPERPPGTAPQPPGGEPGPRQDHRAGAVVARSNATDAPGLCRGPGGDASAGGAFWGLSAVAWYPEALGVWGGQGMGDISAWGPLPPAPTRAPGSCWPRGTGSVCP